MLAPMIESLLIASLVFLLTGWALEIFVNPRGSRQTIGSEPENAHHSSIRLDRACSSDCSHAPDVLHKTGRRVAAYTWTSWISR
jgi:hypothetical protein